MCVWQLAVVLSNRHGQHTTNCVDRAVRDNCREDKRKKKKRTIARFAAFDNLCFSLCFLIVIAMRQMRLLINKQFVCIVGWPSYFSSQFDCLF